MKPSVRELFIELADRTSEDREKILAERQISNDVRAEVESLLRFDRASTNAFTGRVSQLTQAALDWQSAPLSRRCGRYRLITPLGSGGMGAVYLAEREDGEIEQQVAVKILRADADLPTLRGRFLRERQLLADLNHPSIARLYDAGHADDGRPYLVMEYVHGVPIDAHAATLPLRDRLSLFVQVCEAVSAAHRHLIIHRDLKPSNILVDASGNPKLLDFGIAKLLNDDGDETQPLERMLTPNYASPEQLRGGVQTTATDIYSLGAVLHTMLTGTLVRNGVRDAVRDANREEPLARLPRDLQHILAKTLREEPGDRYGSVEALANDIRAFLESKPIQARSGNRWYIARRFVRRFWLPIAAIAFAITALAAGLWIAERQRRIAEQRFNDVRQLSSRLFDIDRQVLALPGSTRTREFIVDMSLEYLRRLSAGPVDSPDLALEVGTAYMRVGRVQGVPISPNLGQMDNAEKNLQIAEKLVRGVLASEPSNRLAFLRISQILHDRMVLAEYRTLDSEALPLASESEQWLNRYLAAGAPPQHDDADQALLIGINVANWYSQKNQTARAITLLQRTIDLAKLTDRPRQVAAAQITVARAFRRTGELDAALRAAQDAVRIASSPSDDKHLIWQTTLSMALSTEAAILGEDNAVSLGRTEESLASYQRGYRLELALTRNDASDTKSRMSFAIRGNGLAGILRHRDPKRAVEIYDEVLARLAEVPNNSRARTEEVRTLTASTYPLDQLGRTADARKRLDAAFERLKQLDLYPATKIDLGSVADDTLRALADHEASEGYLDRSLETYRILFASISAAHPEPVASLAQASDMSRLYASLATIHRKAGEPEAAIHWDQLRAQLWRDWDRKLPMNPFIQRQLEASKMR